MPPFLCVKVSTVPIQFHRQLKSESMTFELEVMEVFYLYMALVGPVDPIPGLHTYYVEDYLFWDNSIEKLEFVCISKQYWLTFAFYVFIFCNSVLLQCLVRDYHVNKKTVYLLFNVHLPSRLEQCELSRKYARSTSTAYIVLWST